VDANEPPLPAMITRQQAKKLGMALARGEEQRTRIGLTIGRDLIDEATFEASPYGVIGRAREKVGAVLGHDSSEG
jgi:pyruvate dehydrogenase (quinone)/pyruvate oxidase